MLIIQRLCKSLENLTPLPGTGLKQEGRVSYTIAFHVAVYDETQRLAPRAQKMKPGRVVLRNNP
jgi:hypothetical protein